MPGAVGAQENRLAVELGLPMLAGDPFYTTESTSKTAARALFKEVGVEVPLGCKLHPTDTLTRDAAGLARAKQRSRELERMKGRVIPIIGEGIAASVKVQQDVVADDKTGTLKDQDGDVVEVDEALLKTAVRAVTILPLYTPQRSIYNPYRS